MGHRRSSRSTSSDDDTFQDLLGWEGGTDSTSPTVSWEFKRSVASLARLSSPDADLSGLPPSSAGTVGSAFIAGRGPDC